MQKRRNYSPAFKSKVALCAIRGEMTLPEMIERFWRTLKYEEVYLNSYDTMKEAIFSIGRYIWDYNNCRPHSSFKNKTLKELYENDFVLI